MSVSRNGSVRPVFCGALRRPLSVNCLKAPQTSVHAEIGAAEQVVLLLTAVSNCVASGARVSRS